MTNNLSVSFITFAGGIVFGLGTFLALFQNGMMLGVIGAACHHYDMSLALWSFVAPHGSLELPSIIIAGAAGFRLGHAMLFPGALRWKESVARGGVEATQSGLRHHSPAGHRRHAWRASSLPRTPPIWLKFTVGGLLFVLLNLWLFRPVKPATIAFEQPSLPE